MGVLIRFRSTELTQGPLVHYREATSYAVMRDNTVELLDGGRNVGVVHADRWDSVEIVEAGRRVPEGSGPVEMD